MSIRTGQQEISQDRACRSDQGDSSPAGQGVPIRLENSSSVGQSCAYQIRTEDNHQPEKKQGGRIRREARRDKDTRMSRKGNGSQSHIEAGEGNGRRPP